jgi:hypothetical protein
MEMILGLILQLLILACQIAVCILGYVLVRHKPIQEERKQEQDVPKPEPSEDERRMQEQMQKMMDGMNNIFGYDGRPQGDKR